MEPAPPPSPEIDRLARATAIGFLSVLFVVSATGVRDAFRVTEYEDTLYNFFGSADMPGITRALIACKEFLPWLSLAIPALGVVVFFTCRPRKAIVGVSMTLAVAFLFNTSLALAFTIPIQKVSHKFIYLLSVPSR